MASATQHHVTVVGIDFSELSNNALDEALEAACRREDAEIHVVYVAPDADLVGLYGLPPAEIASVEAELKRVQERASERLKALGGRLGDSKVKHVVAHFRRGGAAENIAQLAADLDADLVVVGSHGYRGLQGLLLGSVAQRVAHLARCAVWIIRPKDHGTTRVPDIEPPCPECLDRRKETSGADLWCARHAEHHAKPHRYSYSSPGIYASETAAYGSTPPGRAT